MWQLILITVTLIFLLVASYTDLKKREVPDWLNYGLIFAGLGLRSIFSLQYGWMILLNGMLGFLFCFGIAYLFYRTNQWGGGDSKLLMGMGAVIGLGLGSNFSVYGFDFSLFLFFIGTLLLGAIFGLFWCMVLAARKRKVFLPEIKTIFGSLKRWHLVVLASSAALLILSLFFNQFWPLVIFPIGSFYLLCFIRGVEKSCFVKETAVENLTEGDWLAEDVIFEGKTFEKNKALVKEDLRYFKRPDSRLKKILIKEGIPFVPSFLLSYLFLIFGSKLISLVYNLLKF